MFLTKIINKLQRNTTIKLKIISAKTEKVKDLYWHYVWVI